MPTKLPIVIEILRWLLPAFLLVFSAHSSGNQLIKPVPVATKNIIANHATWKVLLHLHNSVPQISDPQFILSGSNFSLLNELNETLALFYRSPERAMCRFPARLNFIDQFYNLGLEHVKNCDLLQEYLDKVPFDSVELIYASEVLASSTSMMGHSFLKVSGINKKQKFASHSLSFFSEINTFNPFKLVNDALIDGMSGFFLVRPYEQDKQRYIDGEQRNIWSYELNISPQLKKRIQLHIWELKDIDITYYFQSYNCATLTLEILSIADHQIMKHTSLFVSPLDVVKASFESRLIVNQAVDLSADWKLAMLKSSLPAELTAKLEQAITAQLSGDLAPIIAELTEEERGLALAYLEQINTKKDYTLSSDWLMRELLPNYKQLSVDLSKFKNPVNTLQDSSVSIQHINAEQYSAVDIHFLPASHYLRRNNRQYFSESELIMGEIGVRFKNNTDSLELRRLTLYAMRNLIPTNVDKGAISSQFYLGFKQRHSIQFGEQSTLELSGGAGKSYQLHNDLLTYGLINAGITSQLDNLHPIIEIQIGAIANLVANSKFLYEHTINYAQFGSHQTTRSNTATLSYGLSDDAMLNLIYQDNTTYHGKEQEVVLGFDYLF